MELFPQTVEPYHEHESEIIDKKERKKLPSRFANLRLKAGRKWNIRIGSENVEKRA